jgi:CPA1 family monovalent cation:H+ antiporter
METRGMSPGFPLSQSAILLLFLAAIVAMATRRLHLPYSVGLVIAGVAFVLLPGAPALHVPSHVLYTALLPPLLFEAAFYLRWEKLRRELALVLTLAVFGVLVGGAVSAAGLHFLAGWPWAATLVFGALIAATDPVSVLAVFREARARGRLSLLIESESLLNDGVAAVAFAVTVAVVLGQSLSPSNVALRLGNSIAGAVVCGAVVGGASLFLIGHSEDHLVELTFTTVAAWGSFLLAEYFQASGVLAVIVAGLVMGNAGLLGAFSKQGREAVGTFWEYSTFLANSMVFLLIGIYQAEMYRSGGLSGGWRMIGVGVLVVLVGRAVSVYGLCGLFHFGRLRVSARHQHALVWGGLRGALALTLALGLPDAMAHRQEIVETSFGVVAFSVLAQGLTMPLFLRRMGELPDSPSC